MISKREILEGDSQALVSSLQNEATRLKDRVDLIRQRWDLLQEVPSRRIQNPEIDEKWMRFSNFKPEPYPLPEEDIKLVSLDVFDTLLRRRTSHPHQVFELLEQEIANTDSGGGFKEKRIRAEQALREKVLSDGTAEDITLDLIYNSLGESMGWNKEETSLWMNCEIELEQQILEAIPEGLLYVEELAGRGIPFVLVSEMYLDSKDLAKLCRGKGFPVEPHQVFTSGSLGKSKGSGNLYRHILQEFDLQAEEVLHLGDHPVSDVEVPKSLNLNAKHITKNSYSTGCVLSDILAGTIQYGNPYAKEADYWRWLGFKIAGPLHFAFAHWILSKSIQEPSRPVWFLARDGYYLKQVYDKLAAAWGIKSQSHYVYASRQFLNLATMEEITAQDWDFLLKASPGMRVRDFFNRVGISEDQYQGELANFGFKGPDQLLTHHWGFIQPEYRDQLYHLFVSIIDLFYANRDKEAEKLKQYLGGFMGEEESPFIVDLGWHGSSFRSFDRWFQSNELKGTPTGLYLHLWPEIERNELLSSFSLNGDPEEFSKTIKCSVPFFEALFTAPHGTLKTMEEKDGELYPVFDHELTDERVKRANTMGEGINEFASQFVSFFKHIPKAGNLDFINHLLRELLLRPDSNDLSNLGSLHHEEGWGVSRSLNLLPDFQKLDTENEINLAYAYCPWKSGFEVALKNIQAKSTD